MKDHHHVKDNGERVPVSDMVTEDINKALTLLGDGGGIMVNGGPPDARMWIIERLRIELLIRALGLRLVPLLVMLGACSYQPPGADPCPPGFSAVPAESWAPFLAGPVIVFAPTQYWQCRKKDHLP